MRSVRMLVTAVSCLVPVTAFAQPNGISVSPAKVFDNRSLVIMLEQLEAQLRNLQAIDQQKVLQGLASMQGGQVTDVARTLSVTGHGTPAVSTTEGLTNDNLRITERVTTDTGRAAPTVPAAANATPNLTFAPTMGLNAQDLLADQISLTYQILNVRMLLERALSDRLYNGKPRLQAVLGFQIGLDPQKNARGRAAVVEITVSDRTGAPISVVSVMPQEKTYNAYAVERRSNAFGGAAVASILTIGYAEQRRNEVLYLYKDADTLAMLSPTSGPETAAATFGWMFRPVLGRQAVSPGVRQMFAILALPRADDTPTPSELVISVRTHWRKYNRTKMTVDVKEEAATSASLGSVVVRSSDEIARDLAPVITNVTWAAIDPDVCVVTIEGRNLFVGSQVLLGRTAYDAPETGLSFKSDNIVELRASMRDVAFGTAMVSGRYGPPVPLVVEPPETFGPGIQINEVRFVPDPGGTSIPVDVVLQRRGGGDLSALPAERPVLTVGTAIGHSLYVQPVRCVPIPDLSVPRRTVDGAKETPKPEDMKCWQLTGVVPLAALERDPVVNVKYPFRGSKWSDGYPIIQPASVIGVTRIGGDKSIKLSISGSRFSRSTQVILDRNYVTEAADVESTLITFDVDASTLAKYKKLIVKDDYRVPVVLDIPDASPPVAVPTLAPGQPHRVRKDTSVGITLTGSALTGIKGATFDGKGLRTQVQDNGKKLIVFISRDVTAKPGEAVILLETGDGIIPITVIVES